MKRGLVAVLAASAILVGTSIPVAARDPGSRKGFQHVDVDRLDPGLIAVARSSRSLEVILELEGTAALRRDIARPQRVAVARQLKAQQDRLDGRIRELGGKVEARFQYAFNGVKVRIAGTRLAALGRMPGVRAVHPVPRYTFDNRRAVPFTGAPAVWQDYGQTGASQTIVVIDTGIDYTHANFGGAGTTAAYDANDPATIEPGSFPTAKVVDGWDFVGDAYDPSATDGSEIPQPDPDPLDCHGHGSHVAGTAAGSGVKADHSGFAGPYGSATYATSFLIGPGVAPEAKLVALKVFGCDGGTSVLTEALEWVAAYNTTQPDAIDVINLSVGGIGGDYGPDAAATDALVESGVVVVASAGNDGPNAYMTGSPANATGALAVAATDAVSTLPGVTVDRATGMDLSGINMNEYPGLPVAGTLRVIGNGSGGLSLGCAAPDYGVLPAGSIAIIQRGVCALTDKGKAAEDAGAIGVILVNRDDVPDPTAFPPNLGYNPEIFDIPMVGIGRGAKATLLGSGGVGGTLAAGPAIPNPTYLNPAEFTSGGPRLGDSAAKPDVAAPGASIVSTASGTGFKGTSFSGTSMSSPHVAGVAALVRALHPSWSSEHVKAAIVGTAIQSKVSPYNPRIAGSGMVQPRRAVNTVGYVLATDDTPSLSFGYDPITVGPYSETRSFTIHNSGNSAVTYRLRGAGIVSLNVSRVTVLAHSSRTIKATANLSVADLADTPSATQAGVAGGTAWGSLSNYHGVVTATPTVGGPGRYTLRIPYRAVPRALSNVVASGRSAYASAGGVSTATLDLTNRGIHPTFADVYAWGLSDPKDQPTGPASSNDIRAVGLQILPAEVLTGVHDPGDRALVFAVNTYGRWSTGSQNFTIIDIFGAGPDPEFSVLVFDLGLALEGGFNGQTAAFVVNAAGDLIDAWAADAPANGSTLLVPLLASDIERTAADATVDYEVVGQTITSASDPAHGFLDAVEGRASLAVFSPAVSTGDYIPLNRGGSATLRLEVDEAGQTDAPALGWMIVAQDDPNGISQADLVPVDLP